MMQDSVHFPIVICGAGPVGQTLALLLYKAGVKAEQILLLDNKSHQQAQLDARSIALSFGSRQILQSIGAWSSLSTPIQQIHVSRQAHFGRCMINAEEYQLPALGYVARYGQIIEPLQTQVLQTGIAQQRPMQVQQVLETEHGLTLQATNQTGEIHHIHAEWVIQAEGGLFSNVETSPSPATRNKHDKDYQQTAIVTQVMSEQGAGHCAFERFTDQGPLALLPQDGGYAVVWCVHPSQADELLQQDDASFLRSLQQAFGHRLGKLTRVEKRHHFPLGLRIQHHEPSSKQTQSRVIRIGNAAQILHPVAGQGLNLGLRDAFQLARLLAPRLTGCHAVDVNTPSALAQALLAFQNQRQTDRFSTIRLTDTLARWFIRRPHHPHQLVQQSLLGIGIGLLDLIPPAKQVLAEQMIFGRR